MIAVWLVFAACGTRSRRPNYIDTVDSAQFSESFSGAALNAAWTADVPPVLGAGARLDGGAVRLTMPAGADGKVSLKARLDAARMRGKRLRLVAKVRTEAPATSLAHVALTITAGGRATSYGDLAISHARNSARQIALHTVIDVAADASSIELGLVFDGPGIAWFDDVDLSVLGPATTSQRSPLRPQQIANIATLARAVALIRYLHPSDEAAEVDWDDFVADSIERVLNTADRHTLLETLRSVFSEIAPTVVFTSGADRAEPLLSQGATGTHLARWRRYGPGSTGLFTTYREGRDADAATAEWFTRVHVAEPRRCGTLRLQTTARALDATGQASLFVRRLDPGAASKEFTEVISKDSRKLVVVAVLTPDVADIELGVRVVGRSNVALEGIQLSCDSGPAPLVDFTDSSWTARQLSELYHWHAVKCAFGTCATIQRAPLDTIFDPARDMRDVEIGENIRIHLPLAVWADDTKTLPVGMHTPQRNNYTINDLSMRLAAIVSAWSSFSMLYPYFDDLHVDWLGTLPAALTEAAAAGSPAELHTALWHLVSQLRDAHVKVLHPAVPVDGVLPIAFRRFADKIVVIGGIPEYMTGVSKGDELISLDGVPALQSYERATERVSAATSGWREYVTPYRMGAGRIGVFRRLTIRDQAGVISAFNLPLISDAMYDHVARDTHPNPGTELAAGIFYVDFDGLSLDDWAKLLPDLLRANGIIFDFRGYTGRTAFSALSNVSDRELRSPLWQVLAIGAVDSKRYLESSWTIRPSTPRLHAPVVALVDGRAVSATETVLQMFRSNRLGVLVGETSAGTNGNVGWLSLPGGFSVRFSGLRAAYPDGTTVQGRGIEPDQIVHPTIDGIRAGRDEILEAGVLQLQHSAAP